MGLLDNIGLNFSINPLEWFENQENVKAQREQIKAQKDINAQQLAYNKWAFEQTSQREDSAVQRRVADLRAAGINPLLAAGSPAAASTPLSLNQTAPPAVKQRFSDMVAAAAQTKASVAMTNAQIGLLNKQAQKADQEGRLAELQGNQIDYDNNQLESLRAANVSSRLAQLDLTRMNVGVARQEIESIIADTYLKKAEREYISAGTGLRSQQERESAARTASIKLGSELFGLKEQLMQDQHLLKIPQIEKARIDAEWERYIKDLDITKGRTQVLKMIVDCVVGLLSAAAKYR